MAVHLPGHLMSRSMATPGAAPFPEPTESTLRTKSVRGAVWTIGGFASAQVLRFGSNLILTRLLFPEAFGLMGMVLVFTQGLQMFSDLGIGPSIVQSPRGDDPRFLNTAWTIQAGRGVVLWLLSWAIAAPLAGFYDQPQLAVMIPAVALSAVLSGFESTAVHSAQRHLSLKSLTLLDMAAQLTGTLVTIGLALAHRSIYGAGHPGAVWALVIGSVSISLVRLVLSHTILPRSAHRFCLDRDALQSVLALGRWIFIGTILTFLSGQSDRLIFAKLIPLDLFGIYGIAALLAGLPTMGVFALARSVAFPLLSRVASQEDEFKRVYNKTRLPLLLAGATLVSGLIASGPFLIRTVYDSRYAQAGWILSFLGIGAWFQVLETTHGSALLAQGRSNWGAGGSALKLAGMVALVPLGHQLDGFRGALAAVAVSELIRYLVSLTGISSRGLKAVHWDAGATVLVACTTAAGILAGEAVHTWSQSEFAGLLAAGSLVVVLWGTVALPLWMASRARGKASAELGPAGHA